MTRLISLALPLALAAGLAGCGSDPEPTPTPTPTPTVAQPRTLVPADLDLATLGAKIIGPQGSEVETILSAGNHQIGKMVSFVACPQGVENCNPVTLPEGTIYTYVHRVSLSDTVEKAPAIEVAGTTGPEVIENPPTLFRTSQRAHGFNASIGYAKKQAEAALGVANAISITRDDGHLIWRVTDGQGWKPGTTITFWWQSTLPPKGPEDAYLLEIEGNQAIARGPFPAEKKAVDSTAKR